MLSLGVHIAHVLQVINEGARCASQDLPTRNSAEADLLSEHCERLHMRNVMLDLQLPSELEPRRAAISQALDDQARQLSTRLERRRRHQAYAAQR